MNSRMKYNHIKKVVDSTQGQVVKTFVHCKTVTG